MNFFLVIHLHMCEIIYHIVHNCKKMGANYNPIDGGLVK